MYNLELGPDLPISGTAREVAGTDSATMSENTESDSRIVMPEEDRAQLVSQGTGGVKMDNFFIQSPFQHSPVYRLWKGLSL